MTKLNVVLVKSGIGYDETQKRTLKAMGLRRLNQSVTLDDCASTRGMINKVRHLVKVEEKGS